MERAKTTSSAAVQSVLTPERARTFQGVLLALLASLSAEFVLVSERSEGQMLVPICRSAIAFLSIYLVHRFAIFCFRSYRPTVKDLTTLMIVILLSITLAGASRLVSESLATQLSASRVLADVDAYSFYFGIPFSAGGLLLQAVLGPHYGLVYGLILGILLLLYSFGGPFFFPFTFVTILVGCLSLSRFRTRAAYLRAGMNVSLVALPFAFVSVLFTPTADTSDIIVRIVAGFSTGIVASFIAAGVIPILEHIGGYVTDLRLIEMATLDHPLLKELSIQCPGTWNHSMVMGMMSEAAASAVGANAVVSRVGAYFHDIGKVKKPIYFVENQAPGENRHDKLSPSMSALIIRSHVKDGIELARKHRIPQVIEDMIPQHHGTSRIDFFYDKACKEAEETKADGAPAVDESLYRYPGPKPQTKEAGILMLADGVEAAARTLAEPTHDRIQGLVQKMINKVFASGELDECELTLRDLHAIAKCFTRVLTGIYHQRVSYAEPAEKGARTGEEEQAASAGAEVDSAAASKKPKGAADERAAREGNQEDLKRLGL